MPRRMSQVNLGKFKMQHQNLHLSDSSAECYSSSPQYNPQLDTDLR